MCKAYIDNLNIQLSARLPDYCFAINEIICLVNDSKRRYALSGAYAWMLGDYYSFSG
jgi:hypothetical protein